MNAINLLSKTSFDLHIEWILEENAEQSGNNSYNATASVAGHPSKEIIVEGNLCVWNLVSLQ